ncbi:MAG: transporter substrate-binding domain-containing protein [Rhodocyclaceae bacterium]
MKGAGMGLLRLLCVAGLLLCGSVLAAEPPTLRICHEPADIHPWSTRTGKGLNFELLAQVAKTSGVRFEYDIVPWKRCLILLKNNEVDGAFAGSFKPDRMESGAYPMAAGKPDTAKRLHIDRYVLVRRLGSPVGWDGKRLTNLKGVVGVQLGYSIADQLKSMQIDVDEGAQSAEDVLRKLVTGRVDAAALLTGEAQALLARTPELAARVEVLSEPLVEKPYFLLLSHGLVARDEKLALRIWDNIEKIRESGTYQARERAVFAGGVR